MLEFIRIKNFQSHEDTTLEFSSGVNCIRGISARGKTAILRALNWVVTNRPLGFRFHSRFAKSPETEVVIGTSEGVEVRQFKTKSSAAYAVNDRVFSAMGSGVPDAVQEALRFSEMTYQSQLDPPFLISEKPGEIARVFNRIMKIERVDRWISSLTTSINSLGSDKKRVDNHLRSVREQIESYSFLPEAEKMVGRVAELDASVEDCDRRIWAIRDTAAKLAENDRRLEVLEEVLGTEKSLKYGGNLLADVERIGTISSRLSEFVRVRDGIREANRQISWETDLTQAWESFWALSGTYIRLKFCDKFVDIEKRVGELGAVEESGADVKKAAEIFKTVVELDRETKRFRSVSVNINAISRGLESNERETVELEEDFQTFLESVEICPICYQKFDSKRLTQ